ncbi:MAG: aminoglycoside phosphotransferase family protein [Thermodesulfobacteriota bacterium]
MDTGKNERQRILTLLARSRQGGTDLAAVDLRPMSGDGSDRVFYRIRFSDGPSFVAAFPSRTLARGREEQAAAFAIGVHLHGLGVPVPKIVAYDRESGLLIFEDLGDVHLHKLVSSAQSFAEVQPFYEQAIEGLVRLQVTGCTGFDPRFCWDTLRYDETLMLERESDYFRQSFCLDYMGKIADDPGLLIEFRQLARRAAQQPNHFLLHRDFQCRNLLVYGGAVHIIDYQGARFGPLAYDLASLLIDPYAGLAEEHQDALLSLYLDRLAGHVGVEADAFLDGYHCLALQRNLQILGAFSFLSGRKGKPFFEQFIPPALDSLKMLLRKPQGKEYPVLAALVDELHDQLARARFFDMDNEHDG